MTTSPRFPPHPANVHGDFYVEDGCCTMCEVPFRHAPGLFGVYEGADESVHCYVQRQPNSANELDLMIDAISCAEFGCIHYRGTDHEIQNRIVQLGETAICDNLLPDVEKEMKRRSRRWWSG